MSTTFDLKEALKFADNAIFFIRIEKDFDGLFSHSSRSALYVENITEFKGEKEVIFPLGT